MTTVNAVMDWLATERHTHPALDDDADALLIRLLALDAQQQSHQQALNCRASIALFGHSQPSKAHLLRTLCGSGEGRLTVQSGSKTLDYFSHINPGHSLTQMALRFSRDQSTPDDAFPLRLKLMREADLVQLFIAHAWQRGDIRPPDSSVIAERLRGWQSLRQPQPVPGLTATDIAAISRFWRDTLPGNYQQIDDALWYQFAHLLPSLDLSARARAWSLLWGEQQELTQQWLTLAHTLHQLGNRREVMAPLSLLVDAFTLPMDAFLTPGGESNDAVLVHPLTRDGYQNAVSVPVTTLAQLTLELVLSTEHGVLDNVDIIDIPVPPLTDETTLWASKCRWLLDYYRQQQQPDILLTCNVTAQRSAIPSSAKTLLRWVNETQPVQENKLPGLVWAITPEDDRFIHKRHFDEAIQQLVGKPGQHWGTLQALDHSSLQRLIEWLSQASQPELRQRRFAAISSVRQQQLRTLCQPLLAPAQPDKARVETMIRELQTHAARHGELLESLLPELAAFDALCQVQQQREEKVSGLFNDAVDLFAAPEAIASNPLTHQDNGLQAYALWCKHLRQWSRQPHALLSSDTQQQLALSLLSASQHLSLAQQLRRASAEQQAGAAQLRAIIGNFINWLGYAEQPVAQRPASRIAKGSAIFVQPTAASRTRLTQLGEQPVHAATRYVYDWLVALYARSIEPGDAVNLLALRDDAQQRLHALLR
ncbi:virulence factor SrfC family protein [Kluyvera sichuanensis]|uniref:virulence factor SrfC family protein n=1 Tax=Kluyvera sichuanensis TaxID=2725494 RepID=UPI0039F5DC9F